MRKKRTSEYQSWANMIQRCTDPNSPDYPRYGGRGIRVCARWRDYRAFLEDMGPKPTPQYTIERKDNALGYTPENCRWATRREQAENRSNTRMLTLNGVTRSVPEWSKLTGIPIQRIHIRLQKHSPEVALTMPYPSNPWFSREGKKDLCTRGHQLSETRYNRPDGRGTSCRECDRIRAQKYRDKLKKENQ